MEGFRRTWNVAMDNREMLPDYRYYLEPSTRARPPVFVTYLNIVEDLSTTVNGVLIPASESDLEVLDARERHYSRLDVTDRILEPIDAQVWVYVGSVDARRRYEDGQRRGTAVVDKDYYDSVRREFSVLGATATSRFIASTDEPECPVRQLMRVDPLAPTRSTGHRRRDISVTSHGPVLEM
jgi:hypothetical protein